ncbi:hypothetical protein H0Z60_05835 [Ectothiorhodospiraceae bacterium WFHF3C12]|nr:hypothetical protein [Ectothiorhodospiraceae bacterium WFHF3C12]
MDIETTIDGIPVTVTEGAYANGRKINEQGRAFIRELIAALDAAREFAGVQLVEVYNEGWLGEGEAALSDAELAAGLSHPSLLVFDEPGEASYYFDDNGLFGGQFVEVMVADNEIIDADLVS